MQHAFTNALQTHRATQRAMNQSLAPSSVRLPLPAYPLFPSFSDWKSALKFAPTSGAGSLGMSIVTLSGWTVALGGCPMAIS